MFIRVSRQSAWRAAYLYSGSRAQPGPLRLSIGIDPSIGSNPKRDGIGAELFGSFGFRRNCTGGRTASWCWRINLPAWRGWARLTGCR